MSTNPFTLPGNWYRGNTHTHSTVSDGCLSVADRMAAYQAAGYDFLVLTDHGKWTDVSAVCAPDFLAIPGSELHPANPMGGDTYHIPAINIPEAIDCAKLTAVQTIEAVNRLGGLAVIGHPYWSGHTILDYLPLHGYFAMEVYNDTCMGIGKGISESMWDDLLDKVGPVFGLAVDDAHGDKHDCFHGWIMVKAPELNLGAIMDALRAGAFYSTTGPVIEDIDVQPCESTDYEGKPVQTHKIRVRCSPVREITFKAHRYCGGARIQAPDDTGLTEAECVVHPLAKYIRVEITDARGRKAWSNPFFFEQ